MRLPDDYPWASGMYGWLCDMRDGYPEQKLILDLKEAPTSCNKISISQDPHFMEAVTQSLPHLGLHDDYELVFSDERKLEITKKASIKAKPWIPYWKNSAFPMKKWLFLATAKMTSPCFPADPTPSQWTTRCPKPRAWQTMQRLPMMTKASIMA